MPDRLAGLFRPFSELDERSLKLEGTGLGLSISHKLAEMMEGEITVESVVGQGTNFTSVCRSRPRKRWSRFSGPWSTTRVAGGASWPWTTRMPISS